MSLFKLSRQNLLRKWVQDMILNGSTKRWKDFLDQTFSVECSPDGFEDFLRWRMRPVLERSCDWPGGVFNFFQEILASVLISEALLITGGNRQKTAQILGISRTTLRNRMQDKEDKEK